VEASYLQAYMCKSESPQSHESGTHSADFSHATCSKPRAFSWSFLMNIKCWEKKWEHLCMEETQNTCKLQHFFHQDKRRNWSEVLAIIPSYYPNVQLLSKASFISEVLSPSHFNKHHETFSLIKNKKKEHEKLLKLLVREGKT